MEVDVAVVDEVVDVDDGFLVLVDDDGTSVHLELVKDNDDDGVLIVLL